jgi:8-oxo-dGTP pyrophosphatase MutT (NUDIX family)
MAPHINEKIDFTAEVFIVYNNKVLLRLHDKYNIWLAVGGHIEPGEDPNEAAVREVKEEVGLDVELWDGNRKFATTVDGNKQLIPPAAMNRHNINEVHEHVSMYFFGKAKSDKVTVEHESDRSDEWHWLTKEEVEKFKLRPDIRFYALEALKTLAE